MRYDVNLVRIRGLNLYRFCFILKPIQIIRLKLVYWLQRRAMQRHVCGKRVTLNCGLT